MTNENPGFNCLGCGQRHTDAENLTCAEPYTFSWGKAPHPNEADDRELQVLAALACGIENQNRVRVGISLSHGAYWEYSALYGCIFVNENHPEFPIPESKVLGTSGYRMRGGGYGWKWNPLQDEGDKYRLARTLELNIDFADGCIWRRMPSGRLIQEYFGGDHGDEGHALLRAAIQTVKHYYP